MLHAAAANGQTATGEAKDAGKDNVAVRTLSAATSKAQSALPVGFFDDNKQDDKARNINHEKKLKMQLLEFERGIKKEEEARQLEIEQDAEASLVTNTVRALPLASHEKDRLYFARSY